MRVLLLELVELIEVASQGAGVPTVAGALRGNFNQLNKLKQQHPHLQTLISIGGWTWSDHFSDIAATEAARDKFVSSAVTFMDQYGFNGIDVDWEYPVGGGEAGNSNRPEDRQNYTLLMGEFREQLDALEAQTGEDYLLTIAAGAGLSHLNNLELPNLVEHLDWINVMSYDYAGAWTSHTGFNSPLYHANGDPLGAQTNVHASLSHVLNSGVPSDKIVMGGPFYGRGWQGVPSANNGLFQSHTGVPQGTWEPGNFDYDDLKENYLPTYTRYWHDEAQVPWLYNPATGIMISYDDPESLGIKSQYIVDNNFGGMMFWELSGDDDQSSLLTSIYDTFNPAPAARSISPDAESVTYVMSPTLTTSDDEPVLTLTQTPVAESLAPASPQRFRRESARPRVDDGPRERRTVTRDDGDRRARTTAVADNSGTVETSAVLDAVFKQLVAFDN